VGAVVEPLEVGLASAAPEVCAVLGMARKDKAVVVLKVVHESVDTTGLLLVVHIWVRILVVAVPVLVWVVARGTVVDMALVLFHMIHNHNIVHPQVVASQHAGVVRGRDVFVAALEQTFSLVVYLPPVQWPLFRRFDQDDRS
jgi:hypothetical protein